MYGSEGKGVEKAMGWCWKSERRESSKMSSAIDGEWEVG